MKPEIKPMTTEETEAFARGSRAVEEGVGDVVGERPLHAPIRKVTLKELEEQYPSPATRAEVADLRRLLILTYTGVSILLHRFGVQGDEFNENVREIVQALASHAQPPQEGATKGEEQ